MASQTPEDFKHVLYVQQMLIKNLKLKFMNGISKEMIERFTFRPVRKVRLKDGTRKRTDYLTIPIKIISWSRTRWRDP